MTKDEIKELVKNLDIRSYMIAVDRAQELVISATEALFANVQEDLSEASDEDVLEVLCEEFTFAYAELHDLPIESLAMDVFVESFRQGAAQGLSLKMRGLH